MVSVRAQKFLKKRPSNEFIAVIKLRVFTKTFQFTICTHNVHGMHSKYTTHWTTAYHNSRT